MVPGWWQLILPEEIWNWQIPRESKATCQACPKVKSDGFRADYRCCTYHPKIPNFLLGFALANPASAFIVESALAANYLTPEGSRHTPAQWFNVLRVAAKGDYGKSDLVLCQFLQPRTGQCGVYAFRNSACASFFCHHDNRESGSEFWESLHYLIASAEVALSQWCLEQVEFDFPAYLVRYNRLSQRPVRELCHPETGAWYDEPQRLLWGDWFDRQEELLMACAQVILDHQHELADIVCHIEINQPDFLEISGLEAVRRGDVSKTFDADSESLVPNRKQLWGRLGEAYKRLSENS